MKQVQKFGVILVLILVGGCGKPAIKSTAIHLEDMRDAEGVQIPVVKNYYGEVEELYRKAAAAADSLDWNEALVLLEEARDLSGEITLKESTDPVIIEAVMHQKHRIVSLYDSAISRVTVLREDASLDAVEEKLEAELEEIEECAEKEDVPPVEIIADTLVYDIPLVYNRRVEKNLRYFQTTCRKPFERYMRRKGWYEKIILERLKKADMPQNLLYQSMIESGFNAHAYSRSHAVGLWQFIASTGKSHGLKINWWVDERRDPFKATDAAIVYMRNLHKMFNDWYLALAAYNAGENGIRRVRKRYGNPDFWNLPRRRVKAETRNYVPKFIAATLICKNPENYGFDSIVPYPPLEYDTVLISRCVSMDTLAACAGIPVDSMKFLNPAIRRFCTPHRTDSFAVNVPLERLDSFRVRWNSLSDSAFICWEYHKIEKGETIENIAAMYGIPSGELQILNGIYKGEIKAGMNLMVPARGGTQDEALLVKMDKRIKALSTGRGRYPPPEGYVRIVHRIHPGEVLGKIAERYGVGLSQLLKWNNLGRHSRIYAGKKLVIYLKPEKAIKFKRTKISRKLSSGQYTVQNGDNLWDIARSFNVTTRQITRWNNLKDGSRIKPGMKLKIYPNKKPEPVKGPKGHKKVMYKVRRGDTIYGIAKKYKLKTDDILEWNGLSSRSVINPGKLIVLWLPK